MQPVTVRAGQRAFDEQREGQAEQDRGERHVGHDERPFGAAARRARRHPPGNEALGDCRALLVAPVDEQQDAQEEELQQGQRGGDAQVEQLRRLAVDLDLERRELGAAEQQDDAEGSEREQEHDRCRRGDGRRQQRQGHPLECLPATRAEHARGVLLARVEL